MCVCVRVCVSVCVSVCACVCLCVFVCFVGVGVTGCDMVSGDGWIGCERDAGDYLSVPW